ncbi:MAG: hypothetical protein HY901_01310 [Deltaproteobacteria bacterium]|nr:hypothetical protein [Deltaproteobacteria bacterium]
MRLLALLLAFCLACALSASCGRTEVYDAVRVDEARGADAHLGRDAGVVDAREEDGSLSRQDAGQGFDATASMQDAASSEQDASEAAPDASAADTGPTTPTVIAFEAWPAPSAPVFITNEELTFRVSYSEPVIVEGEPSIPFLLEGSSRQATYVEGTTTPHLLFRYTIQPGDLDAQGLVIGSAIEVPAGASITGASDLADLSLPPFALTLFVNASLACPAQYASSPARPSPRARTSASPGSRCAARRVEDSSVAQKEAPPSSPRPRRWPGARRWVRDTRWPPTMSGKPSPAT